MASDHTSSSTESHNGFSCHLIGDKRILIECGEILLNRGHKVHGIVTSSPSIIQWADHKGIPQFHTMNAAKIALRQKPFDYLFSIGNLRVIPQEILELPRRAAINFHDGPLPKYAGVNVTSWAIINREDWHGITWHIMTDRPDEGDILKQQQVGIEAEDTSLSLNIKCLQAGIESFRGLIDELKSGCVTRTRQNLNERSYYAKFQRPSAGCIISWNRRAEEIDALVRALNFGEMSAASYTNPLGKAKLAIDGHFAIVPDLEVLPSTSKLPPGTILDISSEAIKVATVSMDVKIKSMLDLEGNAFSIQDAAERLGLRTGERFGDIDEESTGKIDAMYRSTSRHEEFWVKKLMDLRPLSLPYRDRAYHRNERSSRCSLLMPSHPEINTYLQTHQPEWNRADLLSVAFAAYLSRITGEIQFDLGFDCNGLGRELKGLRGLFAESVPLRINVDDRQSLPELFRANLDELESIRTRKTYPRDLGIRYPKLRNENRNAGCPLPVGVTQTDNLEHCDWGYGYELRLIVPGGSDDCLWIYDPNAYTAEIIRTMIRQFHRFLSGFAANNECPVALLPLLEDDDRHRLLVDWNKTACPFPTDLCLHEAFEVQAERTPQKLALIFRNERFTYRELNEQANQLAGFLRKLGVSADTLVGIAMERSAEAVLGVLGILKAGGAFMPLDATYPKDRLAFMMEDAKVAVLLTQECLLSSLPQSRKRIVCIDKDWPTIARESKDDSPGHATSSNLAYVIYTSGSTGKPKGVMIEHRNVVNFFTGMDAQIDHQSGDTWLSVTSLSFDISILEILWTLARGFKLVIWPGEEFAKKMADEAGCDYSIAALIDRHRVTHLQCTPSMAAMLILDRDTKKALGNLKQLMIGGEAFPTSLAAELRETVAGDIINMYGPTETTIWSTTYRLKNSQPSVPIGRPIANTQIYILDKNLQPVPINVPGELMIGGAGVARGYLNRADLTEERFIKNPFSGNPESRLYRTGDLCRYLPHGNIEFLGRMDYQVKIRGYRIELGEIEAMLAEHPTVREAVVTTWKENHDNGKLVAYVTSGFAQKPDARQLRDYLSAKLPNYMVPSHIITLEQLPHTPNKKIDRKALPLPAKEQNGSKGDCEPPRTAIELALARLWAEALRVDYVGRHHNFFELGGDSLLACQIASGIRQTCKIDLQPQTILRASTLAHLAEILEAAFLGFNDE